jgi:hypothetical protein
MITPNIFTSQISIPRSVVASYSSRFSLGVAAHPPLPEDGLDTLDVYPKPPR